MPAPFEFQEGDVGSEFEITITDQDDNAEDISTATTQDLIVKHRGTGATKTFTTVFGTDGEDGVVKYITVSGDLTPDGLWSGQAHVITPSGNWKSKVFQFYVNPNL